jgi:hypothetical protein
MVKFVLLDKVTRLKKIIVFNGVFFFMLFGMFIAIFAIDNFKNYDNPYLFGFKKA